MQAIKLLKHQFDFLNSNRKFLLLCAGIGSGKSFIGSHYIIKRVIDYPKALHFIGANTYSQLRDSTLAALFRVLQDLEIEFSYNQNHGLLQFLNGRVLCKTMDNYDMLRGIEIGTMWLDEVRDLKRDAFNMIMGRLRDKNAKTLEGRLTTSPNGYNYLYDYFHPLGQNYNENFGMINASSYANTHLPSGYIESLRSQYSTKFFQQEILGEFVNIQADNIYYEFDQDLSVIEKYKVDFNNPIIISYDFNIGVGKPMSVAILQYINGIFYFFDEIVIEGTRTEDTLDEMDAKGIFQLSTKFIIHGDASGNARSTNYNKTDYDVIRQYLSKLNLHYEVDIPSINPPIRKRHIIVNGQLKNANHETHIKVTSNCKTIIKGLKQAKLKSGANYIEDDSDYYQHITTAMGYAITRRLDKINKIPRINFGRI
jgi:hypothetical protein